MTSIVHNRLRRIGIVNGPRGPHSLRHAAARHLLDQGMSMKEIGDFLGHRSPSATAVYAKLDHADFRVMPRRRPEPLQALAAGRAMSA